MKVVHLLAVLAVMLCVGSAQSVIGCLQYLNQIRNLYNTSRA